MDPHSRRPLSSLPAPPRHGDCYRRRGSAGADRISSLSDDMIQLVLAHLHCARTAVRTGLLSRRWCGLWRTSLTDLAFHGVAPAVIEAALTCFAAASPAGTAFNLEVCLPSEPNAAQANSLLQAIARAELVFTLPPPPQSESATRFSIHLPCFHRTTSIDIDTQLVMVTPPRTGSFSALERLSVSGRIAVNIGAVVRRCPRLRVLRAKFRDLGLRSVDLALESLKSALRSREVTMSLLDICILSRDVYYRDITSFIWLLGATAGLSPEKLVFTNKYDTRASTSHVYLHSFPRTRSIEIDWQGITFTRPWKGKFFVLESLCLLRCNVVDMGELVSCCPRLRVLRVEGATVQQDITVHSETLRELVLRAYAGCSRIDVVTPVLKEFTMEVHAAGELSSMFVSAPLVDKVSWRRFYTGTEHIVFGFWMLRRLSLETPNSYGERVFANDGQDTSLQDLHIPRTDDVLSLDMCASDPTDTHVNFAPEVEKFPVTNISVVVIHLEAMGHVYGATLLRLLEAPRLQSTTRMLKLALLRSGKYEVTKACLGNCHCDQPKNWRSQSIALKQLEVIEIEGFIGEDHDFDFVELILRCARELKRMTLKLENPVESYGYKGCTKKIHNIFMMYPRVNLNVYLGSRRLIPS